MRETLPGVPFPTHWRPDLGTAGQVLSGPRRLVEAFAVQKTTLDTDGSLMGVGEWTAIRLKAREGIRQARRDMYSGHVSVLLRGG